MDDLGDHGALDALKRLTSPQNGKNRLMNRPIERDREILRLLLEGDTYASIGQRFGISKQRVKQIAVKFGAGPRYGVARKCSNCGALFCGSRPEHTRTPEHKALVVAARERRFWGRVRKRDDGCWDYAGHHGPEGYARCGKPDKYAHRKAYRLAVGPIPDDLEIDHLCRYRGCVNPSHLEPVTHRVNLLRSPITVAGINYRKTHPEFEGIAEG